MTLETKTIQRQRHLRRQRQHQDEHRSCMVNRATAVGVVFLFYAIVISCLAVDDSIGGGNDDQHRGYDGIPNTTATSPNSTQQLRYEIPDDFDAPFGSYPNLLDITPEMRRSFAKVVRQRNPVVNDKRDAQGLATQEEIVAVKNRHVVWKYLRRAIMRRFILPFRSVLEETEINSMMTLKNRRPVYDIGKYDENRVSMYSSLHFQNTNNEIDGFGGLRTVHLGIDLGAPVGTPCFAFESGVVHSVGYNADHGDYGYVIVIEHTLPKGDSEASNDVVGRSNVDNDEFAGSAASTAIRNKKVWALYGHLDRSVLKNGRRRPGSIIRKGEVIGRIGDVDENGGWKEPHVHFQLSVQAPKQPHDMPGASSVTDRPSALLIYPDPRYVLGDIY